MKYFFFQIRATRFSMSTKVYFYLTEGIIYILVQSHKYIYVSRTGSFVLIQLSNTNTIKELKHDGIKGKKPHLKIYLPKYFYSVDSTLKYILFTIYCIWFKSSVVWTTVISATKMINHLSSAFCNSPKEHCDRQD